MKKLSLPEWAALNGIPFTRAKKIVATLNCAGLEIKITGRGKDYLIPEDYKPPEDDTIACMACGKRFQQIAERHVKLHDMTISEYRAQYPDAPLIIKSVGDKISKSKMGHTVTKEMRDAVSRANIGNKYCEGRVLSEETKAKIGNSKRGRPNSAEHNIAIGLSQIGTTKSEASKEKMRYFHRNLTNERRKTMNKRAEDTMYKNYNVSNVMEVPEIRLKIENTNVERYGGKTPLTSNSVLAKIKETNISKTGYSTPFESSEIREKGKQTKLEKYGDPYAMHLAREAYEEQTGYSNPFLNPEIQKSIRDNFKPYSRSSYEKEIEAFLCHHEINFKVSDRTIISPFELDFLLTDFNLAIEFNGLYWHTTANVAQNYHLTKWKKCADLGIQLLMINEDEWIQRPSSIKQKILNLCGKSEKGVGARKLTIKSISNSEALTFIDLHHIQGRPAMCSDAYGAFFGDVMVAALTFFHQRGTGDIELNRFCSDGKIYAGLFSKMLKVARKNITGQIITFADLRYSNGNLYEATGFKKVKTIPPDYRYVKRSQTFYKGQFTKKRIAEKFGIDMTNLTERQAMESLGYQRIYDCGKIKYMIGYPSTS